MDMMRLDLVMSGGKYKKYYFNFDPMLCPYLKEFIGQNNVSLEIINMDVKIRKTEMDSSFQSRK
jgi:hypothetical protein